MSTSVMHGIDFAPADVGLSCDILQPALLYINKNNVLLCEGDPVCINKRLSVAVVFIDWLHKKKNVSSESTMKIWEQMLEGLNILVQTEKKKKESEFFSGVFLSKKK